ncbi:hypothetical protein LCGC14_2757520, partial [marine sediment metagenome]
MSGEVITPRKQTRPRTPAQIPWEEDPVLLERATEVFFGAEIRELDDAQLAGIFADVPSKELPRAKLDGGLSI